MALIDVIIHFVFACFVSWTLILSNKILFLVILFIVDDPKKMKEDLNENTYTNDAYKLYLSDPKHEYSLQNTKVNTTIIHPLSLLWVVQHFLKVFREKVVFLFFFKIYMYFKSNNKRDELIQYHCKNHLLCYTF